MPAADAATVDPAPRETAFVLAGVSAAEAPVVDAPLPNSRPTPPPETRVRLVSLFRPDPATEYLQPAARPVETLDECLVVEICIDEYLWSLYERTPKVDTNRVTERIKTTVKRKGKTRTVTKTITKYVVADFTWKDPIAAQRAGMSLKDYVIGGMDRGFKLKLFRALRAMDDAGLMPGITSAFRDDYRQSIASRQQGSERQLIPWREPPRRLRPRACRRSRERQGRDPYAAIRLKRRAVEVDRCAREGVWDRAPVSRSRPPACCADRWQGICRQAWPADCAKGRIVNQRRRKRRNWLSAAFRDFFAGSPIWQYAPALWPDRTTLGNTACFNRAWRARRRYLSCGFPNWRWLRRCLGHASLLCESAKVLLPLLQGGCFGCCRALQIHREEERPNEKTGDTSRNVLRNLDASVRRRVAARAHCWLEFQLGALCNLYTDPAPERQKPAEAHDLRMHL